jgi:hypothetical protein
MISEGQLTIKFAQKSQTGFIITFSGPPHLILQANPPTRVSRKGYKQAGRRITAFHWTTLTPPEQPWRCTTLLPICETNTL